MPNSSSTQTIAEQVCLVYEIAAFKIREDACEIDPGYFRFRADFCSCQTGFVVGQSPDDLHVRFRTGKYGVLKFVETIFSAQVFSQYCLFRPFQQIFCKTVCDGSENTDNYDFTRS